MRTKLSICRRLTSSTSSLAGIVAYPKSEKINWDIPKGQGTKVINNVIRFKILKRLVPCEPETLLNRDITTVEHQ